MVAFHYPPCSESSGVHRTLKFSHYLPDHGWNPIVLSASPRAYGEISTSQLSEVPDSVEVARTFALDSHRHLALGGKSLGITAIPDRWASWWLSAVPMGLRLIRKYRPSVIWSTYPIATAHLIASTLHRVSGIPWVADFRDIMTDDDYPPQPRLRRAYRWIERGVVRDAALVVQVTASARRIYLERYPTLSSVTCRMIPNGYDEEDFSALSIRGGVLPALPLRLIHAGLIYSEERDPRPFFRALARLRRDGIISPERLRVDLKGAGSESYFGRLIQELGIGDIVFLSPRVPYHEALRECGEAAGLLVLQGPSCDGQIPAKTYEYLRLGRPILALTTETGDTAGLVRECGGATVVDLMDEAAIYEALPVFLDALEKGRHPYPDPVRSSRYARRSQAGDLAKCLGEVSALHSKRSA
jgi:glycosyltransferase involved in cell wall biosynthesis